MGIKDPTAWKDDLTFYKIEDSVADDIEALEPLLLHGGSKVASGLWLALVGVLGTAFGAVLLRPEIRRPLTFFAFVVIAALLLRGFYPLTVRILGKAAGWMAGYAFFWATMLGLVVMLAVGREATWAAYSVAAGGGFFVGMMYGSFPPAFIRNQDAWGVAFLAAPLSASAATYLLRHPPAVDVLALTIAAGARRPAVHGRHGNRADQLLGGVGRDRRTWGAVSPQRRLRDTGGRLLRPRHRDARRQRQVLQPARPWRCRGRAKRRARPPTGTRRSPCPRMIRNHM
jgi:hypothetical protein